MIDEKHAVEILEDRVENRNLRKHMYAVSAIMERLADELDKDQKEWKLTGLLHDIDYEETKDDPEEHGLISAKILKEKLPENCLKAIKAHNSKHTDTEPENSISKALIAADAISGLIVATALVMPESTLDEVRVESIMKKIDDSSFAKSVDRNRIKYCEELGFRLDELSKLSLEAMKNIHDKLGL